MKIIKKDLCNKLFEKSRNQLYIQGLRKTDVQAIVDGLFEIMINELKEGNSIELRGFGTFERTVKKSRDYSINPKTGDEVESKDYYKVSFRQGKKLKNLMKEIPLADEDKTKKTKFVVTSPHWETHLKTLSEYNKRYKEMHK